MALLDFSSLTNGGTYTIGAVTYNVNIVGGVPVLTPPTVTNGNANFVGDDTAVGASWQTNISPGNLNSTVYVNYQAAAPGGTVTETATSKLREDFELNYGNTGGTTTMTITVANMTGSAELGTTEFITQPTNVDSATTPNRTPGQTLLNGTWSGPPDPARHVQLTTFCGFTSPWGGNFGDGAGRYNRRIVDNWTDTQIIWKEGAQWDISATRDISFWSEFTLSFFTNGTWQLVLSDEQAGDSSNDPNAVGQQYNLLDSDNPGWVATNFSNNSSHITTQGNPGFRYPGPVNPATAASAWIIQADSNDQEWDVYRNYRGVQVTATNTNQKLRFRVSSARSSTSLWGLLAGTVETVDTELSAGALGINNITYTYAADANINIHELWYDDGTQWILRLQE